MFKKQNLKLSQLVKEMYDEAMPYGRIVQRETMKDIAGIIEMYEKQSECYNLTFECYWGLMFSGTALMFENNDFGIWEEYIESRYRIIWNRRLGWSIEEI